MLNGIGSDSQVWVRPFPAANLPGAPESSMGKVLASQVAMEVYNVYDTVVHVVRPSLVNRITRGIRVELPRLSDKEAVILGLLVRNPLKGMYGLEMVRGAPKDLKRNTVYTTCARMVKKGFLKSAFENRGRNNSAQRVFRITRDGAAAYLGLSRARDAMDEVREGFPDLPRWAK